MKIEYADVTQGARNYHLQDGSKSYPSIRKASYCSVEHAEMFTVNLAYELCFTCDKDYLLKLKGVINNYEIS